MINSNQTPKTSAKMSVPAAVKWLALAAVLSMSFLFSLAMPVSAQTVSTPTPDDGVYDSLTITSSERLDSLVLQGTAPDGTAKTWDSKVEGLPVPQFDGKNYTYTIKEAWDADSTVTASVDIDGSIDCEFGYSSDRGWYGGCEVEIDISFDFSW